MPHTAGKRLIETITKQLERVDYFSSAENISPNVAVHEIRKIFKRLRALLKFYSDFPDEFSPDFAKQIKFFGRALTHMRETYVNIQIFERISASGNLVPERKIRAAREKLNEKNREVIEQGFLAAEGYLPIQKFVISLSEQMENMGMEIPSQHQFANHLQESYNQAFAIYQFLTVQSDPELVHELRKKLKQLYYQSDFIRYIHPRFFKLKTWQLNNITEHLGEDHDMFIFLTDLQSGNYGFSDDELEIIENKIQHLRELNRIKLFPKLKQFFADAPEVFKQKTDSIFKIPVV
ncbi:MAG: CHAD domain-containing protein [Draconibacterium sp.]